MIKISPSILACDFANLETEVLKMQIAGADMIHLDVMDGHFVPNISFGAPVISSLRKKTDIFFDTHLMISHPLQYISDFAKAGSNRITFHIESQDNTDDVINNLISIGVEPGIAIKPATSFEDAIPYLDRVAQVLVMTVEPGFGGQSFMPEMCDKIVKLKDYRLQNGLNFDIQVDGGIDKHTAPTVTKYGANILVAGSALFSSSDYNKALKDLRDSAQTAVL